MEISAPKCVAGAVALVATAALTACANQSSDQSEAPANPEEQTVQVTETMTTTATSTANESKDSVGVDVVAKRFSTLAPAEFFDKLDTCQAVDMDESYDCSGTDVGQFQFFDSESKATSTAELLTELSSSEVVENTDNRIVGWSTLGTSAIVTVVDTSKGQVLQELVSSDRKDPLDRIHELGLAEHNN